MLVEQIDMRGLEASQAAFDSGPDVGRLAVDGAMVHARIGTVVYGTPEPRTGALGSATAAHVTPGLNHRLAVVGGVLEDDCRQVMVDFFKAKRGAAGQDVSDPL